MRKYLSLALLSLLPLTSGLAHAEGKNADQKMVLAKTVGGSISPKSVLASDNGLISAHNMMYRHSVTIYNAGTAELIATVPDSVVLSDFGFTQYSGSYQGEPIEGTFSPDGKYLYFTNYAMYGEGVTKEGHDTCSPASGYDSSCKNNTK